MLSHGKAYIWSLLLHRYTGLINWLFRQKQKLPHVYIAYITTSCVFFFKALRVNCTANPRVSSFRSCYRTALWTAHPVIPARVICASTEFVGYVNHSVVKLGILPSGIQMVSTAFYFTFHVFLSRFRLLLLRIARCLRLGHRFDGPRGSLRRLPRRWHPVQHYPRQLHWTRRSRLRRDGSHPQRIA